MDLLNGKVADGSLQIRQLEADIAVKRSNGQHEAGNNEIADMGETDLKHHDMQLQHADLTSNVYTLKAKASSHTYTYYVFELVEGCFGNCRQQLDSDCTLLGCRAQWQTFIISQSCQHLHYASLSSSSFLC